MCVKEIQVIWIVAIFFSLLFPACCFLIFITSSLLIATALLLFFSTENDYDFVSRHDLYTWSDRETTVVVTVAATNAAVCCIFADREWISWRIRHSKGRTAILLEERK